MSGVVEVEFPFPLPVHDPDFAEGLILADEDFYQRAKTNANCCGLNMVTVAAHVDDLQLKAVNEWRADVKAYATKHGCGLMAACIAVPMA